MRAAERSESEPGRWTSPLGDTYHPLPDNAPGISAGPEAPVETQQNVLSVKEGETFVCSDLAGDLSVPNTVGMGIYYRDTRFASRFELRINGADPILLSSSAERAHLRLHETSERHWYFEDGKLSKSRDFWKKIEKLNDQLKLSAVDQSLKDFLASLPDDEETRRAKDMAIRYVEGFHAGDIERIGIQGIIKANEAAEEIQGDQMFRFLDGYDSLVQALWAEAESYGATIHLNTVVKEIHWSDDRVEAVCEDDEGASSFAASCAIVTLPLGVLQKHRNEPATVRFVPDLPQEKRAAINHLAMGNVLRIVLRFRERFWEGLKFWDEDGNPLKFADAAFIHYPDAPIPTWWTQLPLRAPVLVGWAGGPRADSLLGTEPLAVASGF